MVFVLVFMIWRATYLQFLRPNIPPGSVMTEPRPAPDPARDREDADRRTNGLAAIVVVLLLLIGGLLLTQTLRKKSQVEDCLMAGRRDCDALVNGSR
jgi:hypothetical protein